MAKRICVNGHVTKDDMALKCSQCGVDLPPVPKRSRLPLVLGILGILFICGVCGVLAIAMGGNKDKATTTGQPAAPAAGQQASPPTATKPLNDSTKALGATQATGAPATTLTAKPVVTLQAYKKGEAVILDSQKVTLNNVTTKGNVVIADVTVENTGSKELPVSSMISFQAGEKRPSATKVTFSLMRQRWMVRFSRTTSLRGTLGYASRPVPKA